MGDNDNVLRNELSMEYAITEIYLPSQTGCEHIHIKLTDINGQLEEYQYRLNDFKAEKTIQNDPVYDFLYAKVQELRLRKRSEIKQALTGIKIYK
jgi:hypothetical protein